MAITQTIGSLGTPPSTNDPANFATLADTLLGTNLPARVTEMNTWASQANALASDVNTNAATATTKAADATSAAAVAQASANFKGTWSSLVGALNKPASVHHNGAFWVLLNNLANVALSEPADGNVDWARLGSLAVKDEGTGQLNAAASLNFVGAAVQATASGTEITVTVSAPTVEDGWAMALAI
jgi:hypothetical protein